MKKIELFIIPYAKENGEKTRLIVDGNKIDSKDNRLTNLVVYQPMRKWLNPYRKKLFVWEGLLSEVIKEFNDKAVHFIFHGCKADYNLFTKSILIQQMKLNRNGEAARVSFEVIDKWNPQNTVKELGELLEDLRVEADNWGEDEIIGEIDRLKNAISICAVKLIPDCFPSPDDFKELLQTNHIEVKDESVLTVIPINGNISDDEISVFLDEENSTNKNYVIVNTSPRDNDRLFANTDSGINIKYIENDGENYIKEIEKLFYLFMLPAAREKTSEILLMFPDYDTNSFLIDIDEKIEELFNINF